MQYINIPSTPHLTEKEIFSCFEKNRNSIKAWGEAPAHFLTFFSRSSIALKYLIKLYIFLTKKQRITLYLPDYFCATALLYLNDLPIKIVYYPVTTKLKPNWEVLHQLASKQKPDLFVLVYYFGFIHDNVESIDFCNLYECLLIEDCAHVLKPVGNIGKFSWAAFYSPYKIIPVPNGSILSINVAITEKLFAFPAEQLNHWFANIFQTLIPKPNNYVYYWLCKRFVLKIFDNLGLSWPAMIPESHAAMPTSLPAPELHPMAYDATKALLSSTQQKLDAIIKVRRENYQRLHVEFSKNNLFSCFNLEANDIPYAFFFLTKPENANKLYTTALQLGIPIQSWPDLPQEVLANPKLHHAAIYLREANNMLPVHQSIRPKHIVKMLQLLKS